MPSLHIAMNQDSIHRRHKFTTGFINSPRRKFYPQGWAYKKTSGQKIFRNSATVPKMNQ